MKNYLIGIILLLAITAIFAKQNEYESADMEILHRMKRQDPPATKSNALRSELSSLLAFVGVFILFQ